MESKKDNISDIDIIIAYAQLAVHTLQNSGNEITPKELRKEIQMLKTKFGTEEVIIHAKIIEKEKKKTNK